MRFPTSCSLTQEATLKDVDHIRQEIHRIKDGDEVCSTLGAIASMLNPLVLFFRTSPLS